MYGKLLIRQYNIKMGTFLYIYIYYVIIPMRVLCAGIRTMVNLLKLYRRVVSP